jgi:hypothetical protein
MAFSHVRWWLSQNEMYVPAGCLKEEAALTTYVVLI